MRAKVVVGIGLLCVTAVVLAAARASASVNTYSVTVYPNSSLATSPVGLSDGASAVGVSGSYPAGFGSGCFQANGTGYSKYGFDAPTLDALLWLCAYDRGDPERQLLH